MNDSGEKGAKSSDVSVAAETSKQVHAHIGSQLRQLFDEVVQEPIPDKFKRLLEDLETARAKKETGAKDGTGI